MGATLCEVLDLTGMSWNAQLSFLIETYFSYWGVTLTDVSHIDHACGKVTIDDKSRAEILGGSSLQKLRTVAESLGPVVTRLALERNTAQ